MSSLMQESHAVQTLGHRMPVATKACLLGVNWCFRSGCNHRHQPNHQGWFLREPRPPFWIILGLEPVVCFGFTPAQMDQEPSWFSLNQIL